MYQEIGVAERAGFRMNRMMLQGPITDGEGHCDARIHIRGAGGERLKTVVYSTMENPDEGVIPVSSDDFGANVAKTLALDRFEELLEMARTEGDQSLIGIYERVIKECHGGLPPELQHDHDVSSTSPVEGSHQVISEG